VLVWGLPSALGVYGFIAWEQRGFRRWPRSILAIGDASYSIYLTHFPLMIASVLVAMRIHRTALTHALWCLATVAACVAGGLIWYRLVERPLLNLMARRRTESATLAVPRTERRSLPFLSAGMRFLRKS
jgi:peptidoglycan/LPS O-acetylase OafA/YrhL